MSLRIAIAIGLVLVLGAAACGNRTDDRTAPPAAEEERPAEEGEGELQELGQAWQRAEAIVTYRQTTLNDAGSESLGTLTLTWKPPSSWRMDTDAEGTTSTTIATAERIVVCAGGDSCIGLPSADDPAAAGVPGLGFFDPTTIAEALPTGPGVERSSETIAGEEASCFSVAAGTQGAVAGAEWCFSRDGILLRYGASGGGPEEAGSFLLEATSVEREVPDDAFDPPFPVTELPSEDEVDH